MVRVNWGQTESFLTEVEVDTMVTRLGSKQAVLVMFNINQGQTGAVISEEEVTSLDRKQAVFVVSRSGMIHSRQADHQKKFLLVRIFPGVKKFVVMTDPGVKTRMWMTTLHMKVASATSTNKILLFLRGRGHHW